ncbi:MAG: class I SAM-dependent methyltransferase, partial [Actinobacteria bacterium]
MVGQLGIPETIRERLPDVNGKHVLHLQCATGESSAQLAELGALVTGVDISAEATAVARERVPNALFLEGDVHQLPLQLERGRFDFVY